jgi:hypothetical protein
MKGMFGFRGGGACGEAARVRNQAAPKMVLLPKLQNTNLRLGFAYFVLSSPTEFF